MAREERTHSLSELVCSLRRGQVTCSPHVEAGEGELQEVVVDFGYLGKDQQKTLPLLVAKDRRSQDARQLSKEKARHLQY